MAGEARTSLSEKSYVTLGILGGVCCIVFYAGIKSSQLDRADERVNNFILAFDKATASRNADVDVKLGAMVKTLDDVRRPLDGFSEERAKVRNLETKAAENREDLSRHDTRIRAVEDKTLQLQTKLDNVVAASSVPLRR